MKLVTHFVACWLHWTPPISKDHYWTLLHLKTLFKSFKNKITTTEKQRDKEHKYQKGRRKLENNILVGYSLLDTNVENYKEQYTNNKRETKELKLKWLRTGINVGYSGHRPLRKITIEHLCIIKRCSNHSINKITTTEKQRDKEHKYQKEEVNWKIIY